MTKGYVETIERGEKIGQIQNAHLLCRTFGHGWDSIAVTDEFRTPSYATFVLRCARCRTLRIDAVSDQGDIERRRYIYPKEYLGLTREENVRSVLRREILLRSR